MTILKKKPLSQIVHGTYSGYSKEKRRNLPHCDRCLNAAKLYNKKYLREHPQKKKRVNRSDFDRANYQAVKALKKNHPREYRALYLKIYGDIINGRNFESSGNNSNLEGRESIAL